MMIIRSFTAYKLATVICRTNLFRIFTCVRIFIEFDTSKTCLVLDISNSMNMRESIYWKKTTLQYHTFTLY